MGLFDRITDSVVAYGQGVVSRVLAGPAVDAARTKALEELSKLYAGEQYEGKNLAPSWDKTPPGAPRVALRLQKPSVQYDLPRLVVDRPTALLFGEGRFPGLSFDAEGEGADGGEVSAWLARIAEEGSLQATMLLAARQGCATGSACVTWSVAASDDDAAGEFEFTAHKTQHCTPTFDPKKPGRLVGLEKRYKYKRAVRAIAAGAEVTKTEEFWHRETWDAQTHTVFVDAHVGDGKEPDWQVADEAKHGLGFVPGVWIKALDDGEPANIDGLSLLDGLGDLVEDIDRTLSQKSRAVRYNQDPERLLFGLAEEQIAKMKFLGASATTLMPGTDKGAAAQLLEMSGEGQRVAEEHVGAQRDRALETARVVSPAVDKMLAAAHSGTALRILHAPTLELVGELRQSFGRALRCLLNQIVRAASKLSALGKLASPPPAAIPAGSVKLAWGRYFDPTPEDLQAATTTAVALDGAGLCDTETLVRWLAPQFGWANVDEILERLTAHRAEAKANLEATAAAFGQRPPPPPPAEEQGDEETEEDAAADVAAEEEAE